MLTDIVSVREESKLLDRMHANDERNVSKDVKPSTRTQCNSPSVPSDNKLTVYRSVRNGAKPIAYFRSSQRR